MARYRLDIIASLARQMAFAPVGVRDRQLAAAEDLAISIDPAKAYAPDYVILHITAYDPKRRESEMLTGLALQHDLGLLIEQVSSTLKQKTTDRAEPVLTIDDLTQKFNVTSKTIQRWRRRGLAARRFVFPDGKLRVGFRLGVVEKFLTVHRDAVVRGANFSQIDDPERDLILASARRLAVDCRCCQSEISRRIARRLNRSPLTVAATIRKHDLEHPDQAILPLTAMPLDETQRLRVIRILRKGGSLTIAARRVKRSRSAIYRVVLDQRLTRVMDRRVKFIDDPLYHQPDAEYLLANMASDPAVRADHHPEASRIPADLPPYLRDLYRTPLLTPARERALFLKFNFHKYQFAQARRRLDPAKLRARDIDQLDRLLDNATEVKNQIVQANLRLVASVAKKHVRAGIGLMELVSEGNITLMRAVESFDTHKGNKFSTYATFALMKGFARTVPQMLTLARRTAPSQPMVDVADRAGRFVDNLVNRDQVRTLMANLTDSERRIIGAQFGIDDSSDSQELAAELGVSRHRLRQLERTALDKLRTAARID
ncbi:MAG: sigma-70 family RNA polymerase sigma factor [Burkholderiales bacterium]|nr:sigma-70 family RNA polymerase sigma factor [Phycisphaerae bacterium]